MNTETIEWSCKVLGVSADADSETVRQAYRQATKRWHPDQFVGQAQRFELAKSMMTEVNIAYDALCKFRGIASNPTDFSGNKSDKSETVQQPRAIQVGGYLFTEDYCDEICGEEDSSMAYVSEFKKEYFEWLAGFYSAFDVRLHIVDNITSASFKAARVRCYPDKRLVQLSKSARLRLLSPPEAVMRIYLRNLQEELKGNRHFGPRLDRMLSCCGLKNGNDKDSEISRLMAENVLVTKTAVAYAAKTDDGWLGLFKDIMDTPKQMRAIQNPQSVEDAVFAFRIWVKEAATQGHMVYINQLKPYKA